MDVKCGNVKMNMIGRLGVLVSISAPELNNKATVIVLLEVALAFEDFE